MRKAIFAKFIQILLAALVLNSAVFYIVTSSVLLKNARKDMFYTLEMMDSVIDYDGDLRAEAERLGEAAGRSESRFTVIRLDGSVAADTGAEAASLLDNHSERQEVSEAMRYGRGSSRRYSDTLGRTMLYTALRSGRTDYILRLAVPFTGIREYFVMLLPASWLSFLAALIVSAFSADRFSKSITRPLKEISQEMLKVNGDYTGFSFEHSKYPEINVIEETTMEMSHSVKEYLNRIELEKQIRQEFFSNASHELKTPVTSIQGYAELLESGMIGDGERARDFARRIKKEAANMADLINDILMISRLENEETEVKKLKVSLPLVLQEVVDSLKPLAAAQEVLINTECAPVSISGNDRQMRELLGNLISNAVKYNRPGGQVWVSVAAEEGDLVIRVRDDGVGIPQESLGRIFERFYRVDKGRSRKQGGTGLGLSIVKHIVNYCHGTITVESKPEKGSEFTVRIPI